ncbi:glycolate oxidase subunit GlcF [Xenophilus arseniciresistens]|uniref:Glycolate oxidase iron-sulfur subunit n=1 Tax=Xenophilus arseniciresistens TaxID=1283306 RepID=A0AAE3T0Q9_9BURK|nr:glycolate oxidase subunit GlcF [Xenophilus arseniciresistens]MDA7418369.1 glycolate oxidase subunit GlcF [Xenophilus arseniciresistens]
MQTELAPEFQGTPEGAEAEAILRKCVHCGFCTATCPTYQLLGDELDGPRGRIYLIKQVLEGAQPTRATQLHLDRCLTCRNCESTCPSGVQYGHLVDIGRKMVDEKVPRPAGEKALRWALKEGLPSPLFAPAMKLGQSVRGLLPPKLKAKVPAPQDAGHWPTRSHARKVLMLAGCVQPSMSPNINAATARVLDAAGIECVLPKAAGCCGAVKFHLNDQEGGLAQMRANIDAWWPYVERSHEDGGVEALVMNASGCGVTVREYGHMLQHDAAYAKKAARISAMTRDISELLPELVPALQARVKAPEGVMAYHPPCTLQHGQKLRGGVETHLRALGFSLQVAQSESHLCCGSAGTYSVTQPELSYQLRDRKLGHLKQLQPVRIASSNMGCITHLQSGTELPVRHWVEWLDDALQPEEPHL